MSSFDENNFVFSVDLQKAAQNQLEFLHMVDGFPLLKDENSAIIQGAIIRYERLWLPLLVKENDRKLVPPLDVEWIWHCHLLSPHAYRNDCMDLFGKILDHQLMSSKERDNLQNATIEAWTASYPDEPFHVDLDVNEIQCGITNYKQCLSYDLIGAVSRQKVFYYQVSLPHYKNETFLMNAIKRYKMYLYLKQQNAKVFLVPFYDIDLVWHSHQLHPVHYHRDTSSILGGEMLNHDDTTNDRSLGSTLYNADLETKKLWKQEFGDDIAICGTMYRGPPPDKTLFHLNYQEMFQFCEKETMISLDEVALAFENGKSRPRGGKFIVKISMDPKFKGGIPFGTTSAESSKPTWERSQFSRKDLDVSTRCTGKIFFTFQHIKKYMMCWKTESNIGSCCFDFLGSHFWKSQSQQYDNILEKEFQFSQSIDDVKGDGVVTLNVKGKMQKPIVDDLELRISLGAFSKSHIPADLESMWGPVPLRQLPAEDNICDIAEHSLNTGNNETKFTCKVIHSIKLMMSAIHVFYEGKMSAVGHLIGTDQLPDPKQVKYNGGTWLDCKSGERAILIKNHLGDWGVVVGRWMGFRKGIPRKGRGSRGVQGCPGYLDIIFRKFSKEDQNARGIHADLRGLLVCKYIYEVANLRINLRYGEVFLDPAEEDIPEHICLAFAISMLHVLCVPRPPKWKAGQSLNPTTTSRGKKAIITVPSEGMAFFTAAGLMVDSPRNYYVSNDLGTIDWAGYTKDVNSEVMHDTADVVDENKLCEVNVGDHGDYTEDGDKTGCYNEGGTTVSVSDVDVGGGCGGCGGCGAGCGGGGGGSGVSESGGVAESGGGASSSCGGGCGSSCGGGGGCGSSCGCSD